MTVPNTTNKVIYTGNDNTEFDYTFKILDASHLVVEQYTIATQAIETLTYETDYTLSGIDDGEEGSGTGIGDEDGGKVTLTAESFPDGLSSDYKLILRRVVSLTQETDYVENDPFPAEVHEEALDKLCMADQQLQEQIDRSIKADPTSDDDLTLPQPSASKLIGWNSDGDGLENKDELNAEYVTSCEAAQTAAEAAQAAAETAETNAETWAGVAEEVIGGTTGTFDDDDLSSGILTITHALSLDSPYILAFEIVNNSQKVIVPDDITFATNTITVDLTSYGTIAGTWGYRYGGVTTSELTVASQLEAEAGTNNDKIMTPLRTKQAITENELDINALTEKTDPVDDDLVLIEDSEDSNAKKKVKRSNIAPNKELGSWTDKSSSYDAQQAATDGFLVINFGCGENTSVVVVYSDANSNPTTERTRGGGRAYYSLRTQITCPIKKNDYWKCTTSGAVSDLKVYWIPLGT